MPRPADRPRLHGVAAVALALLVLPTATGCILADLWKVRRVEQIAAQYAYVQGTVGGGVPGNHWLVVYVLRVPCDTDWRALLAARDRGELAQPNGERPAAVDALIERVQPRVEVAAHVVLQQPGQWYTRLAPGCYGVGAFQDVSRNQRYDDEPAASCLAEPDRLFELRPGDRRTDVAIVIPPEGRMHVQPGETLTQVVRELDARSPDEQLVISIDEVAVLGEIADLDDPRFGRESGRLGYFDIYTFLWTVRPGIYFAEPYDPDRTPVLFIHGALGTPANFAVLAARLDRRRFQPWFFYYPSGARLEPVADFLSQLVARLQREHDLDRLAVVAHSMGGLVARSFILSHHARMRDDPVRLFVSVATPWAGVASARKGTQQSPIVVPSWHDVAEDSEFLRRLFFADPAGTTRRHLPEQIPFHLIFGVEDRTISLTSGIRWEAVRDAVDRWPLAYDHTAILRSPELTQILGEILGRELGD